MRQRTKSEWSESATRTRFVPPLFRSDQMHADTLSVGPRKARMSRPLPSSGPVRGRGVTAVLGPTNTGKPHLAIERLLAHDVGIIGLPLRLLAREVYDKIVARIGTSRVALITGEEK